MYAGLVKTLEKPHFHSLDSLLCSSANIPDILIRKTLEEKEQLEGTGGADHCEVLLGWDSERRFKFLLLLQFAFV